MKTNKEYKILDELLNNKNMYLCFLIILSGLLISIPFEYANFFDNIYIILNTKIFYIFMFLVSVINVYSIKGIIQKNSFILLRQKQKSRDKFILNKIFRTNIIIIIITLLLLLSVSIFWSSNFYVIDCSYQFPMIGYNLFQFLFYIIFFLMISNIVYYFLNLNRKSLSIIFLVLFTIEILGVFCEVDINISGFSQIYLILFNFLFHFNYANFYLEFVFKILQIVMWGMLYYLLRQSRIEGD